MKKEKAEFVKKPENIEVMEQEDARFETTVTAKPEPTVEWSVVSLFYSVIGVFVWCEMLICCNCPAAQDNRILIYLFRHHMVLFYCSHHHSVFLVSVTHHPF